MSGDRLPSALSLVARGFYVFPLKVKGWTPAHKGWQAEATLDPVQIFEWWTEADYNIGVATGHGILVVDVDDKPGKHGSQTLEGFKLNGNTYDTFTVRTPTGGRHLYFRAGDLSNSAGRLGPDLDVRSEGGYVVGAGSVLDGGTQSEVDARIKKNLVGGTYALERADEPREIPGAFLSRLSAGRGEAQHEGGPVELDDAAAVSRAVLYLTTLAPLAIEGDAGDHTTFTVAARVKDLGVSEEICRDLMSHHWNPRCSPPWADFDLRTKVENAYAYGQNPPGIDHPAHLFEGVRVSPPPQSDWPWFRHGDSWAGSVSWLYHGLLPTTGVCLLTAPSQAGKTFIGLDLAKSLDSGEAFFGVEPESPGGTILLVGEAYGSVKMRLAALTDGDERLAVSACYVGALAARGAWARLREALLAEVDYIQASHGKPVRLVVLDTLSACGILEDEDDNAAAATVMKAFADLSLELGALFLILHHPPKAGTGARGAGAITNNADYVMEITRNGFDPIRTLAMVKSRDGEQRDIGSFTLIPKEIGVDDKGRPITTMTVSAGAPGARLSPQEADQRKRGKNVPLLVECVEWAVAEGVEVVHGEKVVEVSRVREIFKERFPGRLHAGNTSRAFKDAIAYAEAMGHLDALDYLGRKYLKLKEFA